MGVAGLGAELPAAGGQWGSRGQSPQLSEAGGLGTKPTVARGTRVWGQSTQCLKFLHFFAKNNLILELFKKNNNAFKTWHRNWQRNMIQLVALMGYVGSG